MQTKHPPTPEQAEAIRIAKTGQDLSLLARAGSGKTTTLEQIARALPRDAQGIALAFNRSVVEELTSRLPTHWSVLSFNSIGYRTWIASKGAGRKPKVDAKKDRLGLDLILKAANLTLSKEARSAVLDAVAWAKTVGFVPDECVERFRGKNLAPDWSWQEQLIAFGHPKASVYDAKIANGLLIWSVQESFKLSLDFDDQCYNPACYPSIWPKPDILLIDEAQDLNPINIAIILRLNPRQLILVGDDRQAIYAFRGAVAGAIADLIARRQEKTKRPVNIAPLTISFRCPTSVIAHAQEYVPDIRARADADAGGVHHLRTWSPKSLPNGSAVLCRNNAPLARVALSALRAQRPVRMLGQDFGKALLSDAKVALAKFTTGSLQVPLRAYYNNRIAKLAADEASQGQIASLRDKADALCSLAECVASPKQLENLITTLFQDDGKDKAALTLSTIHKSKGLEWPHVYFLERDSIPAPWVQGENELLQEQNLCYVAITRAQSTLNYITLEGAGLTAKPPGQRL